MAWDKKGGGSRDNRESGFPSLCHRLPSPWGRGEGRGGVSSEPTVPALGRVGGSDPGTVKLTHGRPGATAEGQGTAKVLVVFP